MDRLTATAASGLRSRIESLDMLANNLSNASTTGFKMDRESYALYMAEEAHLGEPVMPTVEKEWTDFSQGTLTNTGGAWDFALSGSGFFEVQSGKQTLYTRNGAFQLATDGDLMTADGKQVLGASGKPIHVDPKLPVEVRKDGSLWQNDVQLDRIGIVEFPTTKSLEKRGAGYFQWIDPKVQAAPATSTELRQGSLEASNLGAPETAVKLVSTLRQFEMLQRALSLGAEMNRRAVEEVARING